MNILLALALRVSSVFLAPLLIAECFVLHSILPLVVFFGVLYLIAWKYDKDREKRINIRYRIQKVVKD